jgi:RNA-directed DNA polymerase
MEEVLHRDNVHKAYLRVVKNGGAPGIDGMTVEDLMAYCRDHWTRIREELLNKRYIPQSVRKVEIPKPDGKGTRMLGIPTVLDRMIQQALLQILQPIFDPTFSDASFGFRPKRSTHGAVQRAREYVAAGFQWVVDLDLAKFFDRVNHDVLMARVARRVKDKRVLLLIRRYLQAGIMEGGIVSFTDGGPGGGNDGRRALVEGSQGGLVSARLEPACWVLTAVEERGKMAVGARVATRRAPRRAETRRTGSTRVSRTGSRWMRPWCRA